jgi:periplasmic protein TonB
MTSVFSPPKGRGTRSTGLLLGLAVSALLFLAIPLTQLFTEYEKPPEVLEASSVAPPPPPPPPEDPPPPPEPEESEPPPELETPPPPISLEQLDLALNPGTGDNLSGDFALPTFEVSGDDLGGLEIFELGDVDNPPRPRMEIDFTYSDRARRRGITGVVKVEYIVDSQGIVGEIKIIESPDRLLSDSTTEALRRARFDPATKGGVAVNVRMRAAVPYM